MTRRILILPLLLFTAALLGHADNCHTGDPGCPPPGYCAQQPDGSQLCNDDNPDPGPGCVDLGKLGIICYSEVAKPAKVYWTQ